MFIILCPSEKDYLFIAEEVKKDDECVNEIPDTEAKESLPKGKTQYK